MLRIYIYIYTHTSPWFQPQKITTFCIISMKLCLVIYLSIYLNLCLYIYMYVCVCMYLYIYMYVCVCMHVFIYIYHIYHIPRLRPTPSKQIVFLLTAVPPQSVLLMRNCFAFSSPNVELAHRFQRTDHWCGIWVDHSAPRMRAHCRSWLCLPSTPRNLGARKCQTLADSLGKCPCKMHIPCTCCIFTYIYTYI